MLKENKIRRLTIIFLIMISSSLLYAQSSASHGIIIRVIGRVAFSTDLESESINSSKKQTVNTYKASAHQHANLRWDKMFENQKVSIHVKDNKSSNSLKIKMINSQGCDAKSDIQLSENARELLTTSTYQPGVYSWTVDNHSRNNDPICVVYTVTST
jgi:hypothetical protein